MREATNKVYIEGILSETDLKNGSFEKDGRTTEYLSGSIKIRVNSKEGLLEIPVKLFANKTKRDGNANPAYASVQRILDEMHSIAQVGEADATRVRLTGKISMNEYPSQDGSSMISYPQIQASFVNVVRKDEMKPKADFSIEMMLANMSPELDKEGIETGNMIIRGVVPGWGDTVDVIPFIVKSENVRAAISEYWQENDCVAAEGRLNFTSTVRTEIVNPGFGEPHEETRTLNLSELVITGGCPTPLEGDKAWTLEEISAGLSKRKERQEQQKANGRARAAQRKAPAQNSSTASMGLDLGF